jgi:hypothetical protein
MGMDLSPEIEEKIPRIIQLIKEEVAASLDEFSRESAVEAPPTQGSQSDLI